MTLPPALPLPPTYQYPSNQWKNYTSSSLDQQFHFCWTFLLPIEGIQYNECLYNTYQHMITSTHVNIHTCLTRKTIWTERMILSHLSFCNDYPLSKLYLLHLGPGTFLNIWALRKIWLRRPSNIPDLNIWLCKHQIWDFYLGRLSGYIMSFIRLQRCPLWLKALLIQYDLQIEMAMALS